LATVSHKGETSRILPMLYMLEKKILIPTEISVGGVLPAEGRVDGDSRAESSVPAILPRYIDVLPALGCREQACDIKSACEGSVVCDRRSKWELSVE
jgi:hypothetical protein